MSAHTPGPWRFSEPIGQRPRWEHIVGVDGRAVCTVVQAMPVCSAPDTQEEAEANARLIVVAPALLGTLEDILEIAQEHYDTVDRSDGTPGPNQWMQIGTLIEAALAKAEGKLPW